MELRLLGGVTLDGPEPASAQLERPQSVALLAYLLLGAPDGFHQRDTLTALFWPESDHERARASLRKALYQLRKALGDGVIVNRGRSLVGVEPSHLWCDASELLRASESGEHERVVSLYRGELMPGFFLSDAPEFERWLDSLRARLRDRTQEAALSLADEAEEEGRLAESLFWLERVGGMSRVSEHVVRRIMALHATLGDRAEALRTYSQHVDRLERELQIEPAAETKRLARQIRDDDGSVPETSVDAGGPSTDAGDRIAHVDRSGREGDDADRDFGVRDPDTGLHDARGFAHSARERWGLARHLELPLTLVVVDVENGGRLQEGAEGGTTPRAVRYAARVLSASCRGSDVVGRLDRGRLGVLAFGPRESVEEGLRKRVEERLREVEGGNGSGSVPPPVMNLRATELGAEDLAGLTPR